MKSFRFATANYWQARKQQLKHTAAKQIINRNKTKAELKLLKQGERTLFCCFVEQFIEIENEKFMPKF